MIRDHYLNEEAYKKNLEKVPSVQQIYNMWKDASISHYYVEQFLKSVTQRPDFDPRLMQGSDNYLTRLLDSLRTKYADKVTINHLALKNIQLTDIDTYVIQPNMPFPAAVPPFPQLTTEKDPTYWEQTSNDKAAR